LLIGTMPPEALASQAAAAAVGWRLRPGPLWRVIGGGEEGITLRPLSPRDSEVIRLPPSVAAAWRKGTAAWPEAASERRAVVEALYDGALALDAADGSLCGPAAALALGARLPPDAEDTPAMARSLAALRFAALAPRQEFYPLLASLYFSGRRPCGPAWLRRLPDAAAVGRHLGIDRLAARPEVARWFGPPRLAGEWWFWRAPHEGTSEKLYIALAPDALAEQLPTIGAALAEAGASAFKLPASARGLQRPDRCVAYFPDTVARRQAEATLAPLLAGAPTDPVPFTVSCVADSRLSWGRDPARGSDAWRLGRSWRLWVCALLARGLAVAAALPHAGVPAWRFALLRAALAGLDPARFAPEEAPRAA
jgi:hypothetical protein